MSADPARAPKSRITVTVSLNLVRQHMPLDEANWQNLMESVYEA